MKAQRAVGLERLLVGIVASAPALLALAACGGGVDDGAGAGADAAPDVILPRCGDRQLPPPAYVPYQPVVLCEDDIAPDASVDASVTDSGDTDGSIDTDAAADGGGGDGGDGGDAGPTCETQSRYCARVCSGAVATTGNLITSCTIEKDMSRVVCYIAPHPCGRAHAGLAPLSASDQISGVARWLAAAAYMEDASVASFEILARELEVHGAPRSLVIAARRSARDEVRHARIMSALAQRHGGRTQRAKTPRRAPRELRAMVLENAVEGCVNETYGALLAWHQAEHAADPKIRAAMRRIAEDETRHAALAQSISAWAETRLDEATRAAVRETRARAVETLAETLRSEPDAALAEAAGLPSATTSGVMLRRLADALDLAA